MLAEQDHVGGSGGNLGAAAHGDRYMRRGQCRGVVHPISNQSDDGALLRQRLDACEFVLRFEVGLDLGDTRFARDAPSGADVVAGEE